MAHMTHGTQIFEHTFAVAALHSLLGIELIFVSTFTRWVQVHYDPFDWVTTPTGGAEGEVTSFPLQAKPWGTDLGAQ